MAIFLLLAALCLIGRLHINDNERAQKIEEKHESNSDGLQPDSDGLYPSSDVLQPTSGTLAMAMASNWLGLGFGFDTINFAGP